jgi:hypothetical protein
MGEIDGRLGKKLNFETNVTSTGSVQFRLTLTPAGREIEKNLGDDMKVKRL